MLMKKHVILMRQRVRLLQRMAKRWVACRVARLLVLRLMFMGRWDSKIEALQDRFQALQEQQSERDKIHLQVVKNDPALAHEACDVMCRQTDKNLHKLLSKYALRCALRGTRKNSSSKTLSAGGVHTFGRLGTGEDKALICPERLRERGLQLLLHEERKKHMDVVSTVCIALNTVLML